MEIRHEYARQLSNWYKQPLGRALALQEQRVCNQLTEQVFGRYALQLGFADLEHCTTDCVIPHVIRLPLLPSYLSDKKIVNGDVYDLPFKSDSIDFICLPHSLEALSSPQECLEECVRVLAPYGHLLILGFNRISSWGIKRLLGRYYGCAPWNGAFVGLACLHSWLFELDCEIITTQRLFFKPPINQSQWLAKLEFLERWGAYHASLGSAVYAILARKQLAQLTPIKPHWRKHKLVNGKKLAQPTARGI